jgi:hypothetical protein
MLGRLECQVIYDRAVSAKIGGRNRSLCCVQQEVAAANAILSDPNKRRKYDAAGFAGLEAAEMNMEVDVSSLGPFAVGLVSIFNHLGVLAVKTSVPAKIRETAFNGDFDTTKLAMGQRLEGKVGLHSTVQPLPSWTRRFVRTSALALKE